MSLISSIALVLMLVMCGAPRDDSPQAQQSSASMPQVAGSRVAVRLTTEEVAHGLDNPVYVTAPATDERLFIVEQPGRIRIVQNGRLIERPFLDIRNKVGFGGERGLLSFAFHPRYKSNGFLFVNYTDKSGDTRVERYTVSSGDPNVADPASAKVIIEIDQPYSNHNGGHNIFGLDGMLYIGMGDGGSQGDPHGNGQNRNALLGKILRIDVDRADPYGIPPNNPYANGGGRREIWAVGLRNPWRLAFDSATGRIYIADVGQDRYEEIDIAPATAPGLNYGWNVMDGNDCFRNPMCAKSPFTQPALVYRHSDGTCSIIGGFVYRGRKIPEIRGQYFYSDYCKSWLRSITFENGRASEPRQWLDGGLGSIVSFGEDGQGELYICSSNGRVYRIVKG